MLRILTAIFLCALLLSCTPRTYTFYPAQRKISHPFNPEDSIYVIFPHADFILVGEGDRILDRDLERAKSIEKLSNDYLLKLLSEKFKLTTLQDKFYDRESLGKQFEKMTKQFYDTRQKNYSLKIKTPKKGYGLIFSMDIYLRDWMNWVEISPHQGGHHLPQEVALLHLSLLDLQTGEVLYYKYNFHLYVGGWDEKNRCMNELGFESQTKKNVGQIVKHLLRKDS